MGEFLAILALAMFSGNVIVTKVASDRVNLNLGFLLSVSVNVLFALVVFGIELLLRDDRLRWDLLGFLIFLLAGFFATYLGRWFLFESIARLGPAKASTVQVSNPLFTVIIAWLFLGERLKAGDIAAITTVLVGLFLVSYVPGALARSGNSGTPLGVKGRGSLVSLAIPAGRQLVMTILRSGLLLALFSSMSYAAGNVLRGAAIHRWNEPVLGALIGAAIGVALHLASRSTTEGLNEKLRAADRKGLALYLIGGVLTISGQICTIAAMRYIPVSIVGTITTCTPVLVFPASYLLLRNREGITMRTIAGCLLVLAGIVYLVNY